jgi:hypothetical protein
MAAIADAVTHCRFEATDNDSDEVVLFKILRVLLACLRCPAGALLSDHAVCEMLQTCFRMSVQVRLSGRSASTTVRPSILEYVIALHCILTAGQPQSCFVEPPNIH